MYLKKMIEPQFYHDTPSMSSPHIILRKVWQYDILQSFLFSLIFLHQAAYTYEVKTMSMYALLQVSKCDFTFRPVWPFE